MGRHLLFVVYILTLFAVDFFSCRLFHSLGNLSFFQTEQVKPPPHYYLLTARKTVNHDSTYTILLTGTMLAVIILSLSSSV